MDLLELPGFAESRGTRLDGVERKRLTLVVLHQSAQFVEIHRSLRGDLNLVHRSPFECGVRVNRYRFLVLAECNYKSTKLQRQQQKCPEEAPFPSIHALVPEAFNSRHTVSVSAPISRTRFAR